MVKFFATDRLGTDHTLEAQAGSRAMESLRDLEEGVEALCGGQPNCATCHVYVSPQWIAKLPPADDYEKELLECLDSYREEESRLSCQIRLTSEMAGIRFLVPPE